MLKTTLILCRKTIFGKVCTDPLAKLFNVMRINNMKASLRKFPILRFCPIPRLWRTTSSHAEIAREIQEIAEMPSACLEARGSSDIHGSRSEMRVICHALVKMLVHTRQHGSRNILRYHYSYGIIPSVCFTIALQWELWCTDIFTIGTLTRSRKSPLMLCFTSVSKFSKKKRRLS